MNSLGGEMGALIYIYNVWWANGDEYTPGLEGYKVGCSISGGAATRSSVSYQ